MEIIRAREFSHQSWAQHIKQNTVRAPTQFEECRFTDFDFSNADLSEHKFVNCELEDVLIRETVLDESVWRGVRALKLRAHGMSALGTRFEKCNFSNSDWSGAKLSGAAFVGCKLTGSNFAGAAAIEITFEDSILALCRLRKLTFKGQHLKGVDFSEADLAGANFQDAVFEKCSLRDANFVDAKFLDADLRGADLGSLVLANCTALRGAIISTDQAAVLLRGFGLTIA